MQVELLHISTLVKTYEGKVSKLVLKGIQLSIQKGEFVAIMGPSGSGKTTLLNMVATIDTPIHKPKLLLADEPAGNLDSKSSRDVMETLETINKTDGMTMMMVTHDANAAFYCDRVIFIKDGEYYIVPKALGLTAGAFFILFIVISFLRQFMVSKKKVIQLLQGSNQPKPEPKANAFLLLLAALIRQMYSIMMLTALLVGAVFFIVAGNFLYFRLYTDLEQDKAHYQAIANWD